MDSKTELMVALGTAIGANCIPCFDHLYSLTQEAKMSEADIRKVIETAHKVKNGAAIFLKRTIAETLGDETDEEAPCCTESACSC